ncbi:MAG: thymidine phosphorylase [candidate division KSB1 bacterium]|nr:thymidine phosphorylase [candidate division KSB1 bacterium]MDZ7303325.1 thymidine phosphorylase [candidate division KSB1 bacterium]MDZ7310425.1 thymidine phosphorylase [candidate division KSB1 bacterium]
MTAREIIQKKRDGNALAESEINFFVQAYLRGEIADYEMSALLMAIYFRGMNFDETVALTRIMRDSGEVVDWSHLPGAKVDKHSTGGVGDKVSLILAPLVAAAGVYVPMISGRGLGHTGGTLDKLESIPGFKTRLPMSRFKKQVEEIGTCLIGQTEEICPADRKIYALRDATATVQSIPLICGSILSKKLAEGLDALVLDVKVGNGAIFEDANMAEKLAEHLIRTATAFNLKSVALLTDMSQPLGVAAGNWVEVCEAIEVLKGGGPEDLRKVTLVLGALMLQLAGKAKDLNIGMAQLRTLLQNGAAWKKFLEVVNAQEGEVTFVENPNKYPAPKFSCEVIAELEGYVTAINTREIGRLCMLLGAGRNRLADTIDYTAGVLIHKKVGDRVQPGEPLVTLQNSQQPPAHHFPQKMRACFAIGPEPVSPPNLIHGMLNAQGKHWITEPDQVG